MASLFLRITPILKNAQTEILTRLFVDQAIFLPKSDSWLYLLNGFYFSFEGVTRDSLNTSFEKNKVTLI